MLLYPVENVIGVTLVGFPGYGEVPAPLPFDPAAPPLPAIVPLLLIVIIDFADKLDNKIAEDDPVPVPDTTTPELIVIIAFICVSSSLIK